MMLFTIAEFKLLFESFSDASNALIEAICSHVDCYLPQICCDNTKKNLSMLLVAHMLELRKLAASGQALAITSASEGGVSISLAMPSGADAWGQWLNITAYGQQYAALVSICTKGKSAAGVFFGGIPERDAFKHAYGVFTKSIT